MIATEHTAQSNQAILQSHPIKIIVEMGRRKQIDLQGTQVGVTIFGQSIATGFFRSSAAPDSLRLCQKVDQGWPPLPA